MISIYNNPDKAKLAKILQRPSYDLSKIDKVIKPVLQKVKRGGDKALKKFALEYDHVELKDLWVSDEELDSAEKQVNQTLKDAIQTAYKNIYMFHEAQQQEELVLEVMPGVVCSRKSVAIEKVGLYVPGGTAPLFSTVLMLGIPAKIAGCKEIIISSPTDRLGVTNPVILYTAKLIGIRRVLKLGGAQAIGAMAYGTESVPKVDKIFGPGNQYVTVAKQRVARDSVAIDMPAGPSEVMVVIDGSADAAFAASDLLSQAEHGIDSQVVMVTDSVEKAEEVNKEIKVQLEKLPRKTIAQSALEKSAIIVYQDRPSIVDTINEYGPEHLIINTRDAEDIAEAVVNAGSVFIGPFTPESAGDYASGTNHTLPTNGWAKSFSGVSLDSFVKKITYQQISEEGLLHLGPTIERMAEAELLEAHKNAVTIRLQKLKENGITGKPGKKTPKGDKSLLFGKR